MRHKQTMRKLLTMLVIVVGVCTAAPAAQAAGPADTLLSAINTYRARHGVPAVRLDSSVTRVAQEWANQQQSRGGPGQHRPNTLYGENLFWGSSGSESAGRFVSTAANAWYNENRGYDYSREYTSPNIGSNRALHFTALVWKSTDRIGVGLSQGRNGSYLVVNFAPAGNVLGQFKTNVRPPR